MQWYKKALPLCEQIALVCEKKKNRWSVVTKIHVHLRNEQKYSIPNALRLPGIILQLSLVLLRNVFRSNLLRQIMCVTCFKCRPMCSDMCVYSLILGIFSNGIEIANDIHFYNMEWDKLIRNIEFVAVSKKTAVACFTIVFRHARTCQQLFY
jgi:hypothetical protein